MNSIGYVEIAAREWRNSLTDYSKKNQLLYFKDHSAVDLGSELTHTTFQLLRGDTVDSFELLGDRLYNDELAKVFRSLYRNHRTANDEHGAPIVHLAIGFIHWDQNPSLNENDKDSIEFSEDAYNSPLIIVPASIQRSRSRLEKWEIQCTDQPTFNGLILQELSNDGIDFDLALLNEHAQQLAESVTLEEANRATTAILAHLKEATAATPLIELDSKHVLGSFKHANLAMIRDLSDHTAMSSSLLVRALAGDPDAVNLVRHDGTSESVSDTEPDYCPLDTEYLILDADASQSHVINTVRRGQNLVIEGPPGTGKSQTIANLAATLIADNKSVLFVAQKRAAIESVLDRLAAAQLDEFIVDLFGEKNSRVTLVNQLRTLTRISEPFILEERLALRTENNRDKLVLRHEEFNSTPTNLGLTVNELYSRLLEIPAKDRLATSFNVPDLDSWTSDTLSELIDKMKEISDYGGLISDWDTKLEWDPHKIPDNAALLKSRQLISDLRHRILRKIKNYLRDHNDDLGLSIDSTFRQLDHSVRVDGILLSFHASSEDGILSEDLSALNELFTDHHEPAAFGRRLWRHRRARKIARRFSINIDNSLHAEATARANELVSRYGAEEAEKILEFRRSFADAYQIAKNALEELFGYTRRSQFNDLNVGELLDLLDRLFATADAASKQLLVRDAENILESFGLGPLLEYLRSPDPAVTTANHDPIECLKWTVLEAALAEAKIRSPRFHALDGDSLNSIVAAYSNDDRSLLEANQSRIRSLIHRRIEKAKEELPTQLSSLVREINKKARHKPVREVFEESADFLLESKPIWAMSPLQVSQTLPPSARFDVVIFDEASQVVPAAAIPALMRARQVVVAGDTMQLPPNSFFSKGGFGIDRSDDNQSLNGVISGSNGSYPVGGKTYTKDIESILLTMDHLLAGRKRQLLWHYRSQDERLIAVSNRHIYDRSLITFPASQSEDTLRHVVVPYSEGESGTANSPSKEVEQVVTLIEEHSRSRPTESLGVISFGQLHANRIEMELQRRLSDSPDLADWVSKNPSAFFIKSIENVQGDERDSIILTVGYGKKATGGLDLFWGPLLRPGGEKRLNVAISRARNRMTLVSSFDVGDLPLDRHPSEGYKLMCRFVRFMSSNGRESSTTTSALPPKLNAFERDVRDRLVRRGLALDCQYGVGRYRIDFAIRHPEFPGNHVLAVEADGASYHSGRTARERDRLRQQVLESRGWTFHRIWSTDWFNDAEGEVDKVVSAFERAVANYSKASDYSISQTKQEPSAPNLAHEKNDQKPGETDSLSARPLGSISTNCSSPSSRYEDERPATKSFPSSSTRQQISPHLDAHLSYDTDDTSVPPVADVKIGASTDPRNVDFSRVTIEKDTYPEPRLSSAGPSTQDKVRSSPQCASVQSEKRVKPRKKKRKREREPKLNRPTVPDFGDIMDVKIDTINEWIEYVRSKYGLLSPDEELAKLIDEFDLDPNDSLVATRISSIQRRHGRPPGKFNDRNRKERRDSNYWGKR